MKIISKTDEIRQELAKPRQNKAIGLVPTMGYLHQGHLALVRKCRKENFVTVVTVFVNPAQFGPGEDFGKYPRDLERDATILQEENVDYLFCPSEEEMYPQGFATSVHVSGISEGLCGAGRPGHFDGVAVVISKLFNIIKPVKAYFGLKDYQQYLLVRRLVRDLNMDVDVIGVPTVRESDGLAMSSRNVYLSREDRDSALSLYRSFDLIRAMLQSGKSLPEIGRDVESFISSHKSAVVEYVAFVDPESLKPVTAAQNGFMCMLAVRVGRTRLIDNCLFK